MAPLRIVYMGTPDFAVPPLAALIDAGHEIIAVYSQPPRPAGRGQKPRPGPVQRFAGSAGIPVRTPKSLRKSSEQQAFCDLGADLAIVAAYGLILPRPVLEAPKLGCINIHASLLPRWRGAAPIHRAILTGDAETGISIMQMDEGLDTGPVLLMQRTPINADETAGSLHDRLAALGASALMEALGRLRAGTLSGVPQPEDGACYADKISKAETRIDWSEPADAIERKIRAFHPAPGSFCDYTGVRLRLHAGEILSGSGSSAPPGTVLDDRLAIACGSGSYRILHLQREGRGAMDADAFLRGFPIPKGARLG